jgi:hypothetical protein
MFMQNSLVRERADLLSHRRTIIGIRWETAGALDIIAMTGDPVGMNATMPATSGHARARRWLGRQLP